MRSLVLTCLVIGTSAMASEEVVTVRAFAGVVRDGQFLVSIRLDIQAGWHTYASVGPDSTSTVTAVSFETPKGVKKVGKLSRPLARPYLSEPGSEVLSGRALFSQRFELSGNAARAIKVTVKYQACDDKKCMRPTSKTVAVDVPSSGQSPFEPPVRLMSGDQPLNAAAKQMYPSPAWYDIDGDDQAELVVGDIFGKLNVYENQNTSGKGDPIWGKPTPLKNSDGKQIKVSNW